MVDRRPLTSWWSFALLFCIAACGPVAHAQSLYWSSNNSTTGPVDGAGAWLSGANWWTGSAVTGWSSGANATFGVGGAGGAVTLASPTTAGNLTFNYFTGTYTLGSANQTLTLNGGITKGAGTGTVAFAGPLALGANQTWTNNSGSAMQVSGVQTLNLSGFNLSTDGFGKIDFGPSGGSNATISGSGGIIKNGAGDLVLDSGSSVAHTFTGGITVNGGRLGFQTNTNVSGRGNVKITGGYLGGRFGSSPTWSGGLGTGNTSIQITGGVSGFSGEGGTSSTFTIGTGGSTLMWGANGEGSGATGYFNPSVLVMGGLTGMNTNAKGSLNNAIDLNGTTRTITSLHTNGDGASTTGFTLSGAITSSSGTAGLIKTGAGSIILNGTNTYNGTTSIQGGSIILSSSTATINNTSAINLSGGGTLRLGNSTTQVNRVADSAIITVSTGGGITYENTAANGVAFTETVGAATLNGGQFNVLLSNNQTLTGNQTLTFGGNFTRTGSSNTATVTFSAGGTGPQVAGNKNMIVVTGAGNTTAGQIIGPWATTGTAVGAQTDYAVYNSDYVTAANITANNTESSWTSVDNINFNTGVTLTGNRTVNTLRYSGTANTLDLSSSKMETYGLLNGGGALLTLNGTVGLTAPSGGTLYLATGSTAGNITFNAPIISNSGDINLVKSGAGTATLLAASNTFNGTIAVNAGTLQIGSNTSTQLNTGTFTKDIFIGAGATLTFQGNSANTLSGNISGAGNLNLNRGTTTLSGNNTYTGKTVIGLVTPNSTGTTVNISSFNSVVGGNATSSLGAPTTVANGTIDFGGGVQATAALVYNGSGETTDRVINFLFNNNSSTRNIDASNATGLLKFTSPFISNGSTGNVGLLGSGNAELVYGLPFSGSSGVLTKSGGGTWTIGGAVGLTGGVTLNGATAGSRLNLNHPLSLGTGTFTISGGNNATVGNTSGTDITIVTNNAMTWSSDFAIDSANSISFGAGAVSMGGNRTIRVLGGGTFSVGGVVSGSGFGITLGGNSTMRLTGNNTFTGAVVIGDNTAGSSLKLTVNSIKNVSGGASALGAPTTTANGTIQIGQTSNSSTLEFNGLSADQTSDRKIQIGSSSTGSGGAYILNNDPTYTVTFSNAAFNVAATGTSTFSRGLRLGGSNTGNNTISGAIINNASTSGTTFLIKQDVGKWILGGTNTYNGTTTISGGTLQVDGSIDAASTVGIQNAGTLSGLGTINGNATLTGNGVINKSAGTIAGTLGVTGGNWNGAGSVTGLVTSSSGTFTIGSGANLTANGNLNITGGSIAAADGTGTITGNVSYTSSSNSTFDGILAGSGKTLTLNNASAVLTLTGNNTYTGATTVTAGTLSVKGSIVSALVVDAGATLSGTGTIAGNTIVQGIHAPGNSPGIQNFGGDLAYSGGNASVSWELIDNTTTNQANPNAIYDQILVGGNLTFADPTTLNLSFNGANSTVSWNSTFWDTDQSWTLHDVAGTTSGFGNFTLNTTDWLDSASVTFSSVRSSASFNVSQSGQDILINYVAVPEPATMALFASAVGLLGLRLARRRTGR